MAKGCYLFEREHHRRIAQVLDALDAPLLAQHGCLFAGGTAMALRYGEYRESVDMDFLVSNIAGYRALRQLLTGPLGVQAIAKPGATLQAAREVRADQYGLRTALLAGGIAIKFEIVLEARITLDTAGAADQICGVACLTTQDMLACKLLANSDRWADDSVFSRDLIDLAMVQPSKLLLRSATDKAMLAYGSAIERDLHKAITALQTREGRLTRCLAALQINQPAALVWQRMSSLASKLGKTKTGEV
jgi:Nucleotidyl transferase AbiEii toxin, Type IV TA system